LRNLKIGTRLSLGFGTLLAILLLVVTVSSILDEQDKADLLQEGESATGKIALITEMRSALMQAGIAVRNFGLNGVEPSAHAPWASTTVRIPSII
jgi:methyl-accepting chemotaxis protein